MSCHHELTVHAGQFSILNKTEGEEKKKMDSEFGEIHLSCLFRLNQMQNLYF